MAWESVVRISRWETPPWGHAQNPLGETLTSAAAVFQGRKDPGVSQDCKETPVTCVPAATRAFGEAQRGGHTQSWGEAPDARGRPVRGRAMEPGQETGRHHADHAWGRRGRRSLRPAGFSRSQLVTIVPCFPVCFFQFHFFINLSSFCL